MDQWLEQKIGQTANASAMQDRAAMQRDPNLYSRVHYRLSYIPPPCRYQRSPDDLDIGNGYAVLESKIHIVYTNNGIYVVVYTCCIYKRI